MSLVFFGTPVFAVPSLVSLIEAGERLPLVVTQPDRRKGRDRHPTPPPVKNAAQRLGIPTVQPERLRDPEFVSQLRSYAPEFIIVIAYGRILPAEILAIPARGCLNVHASLLPAYRGAAPIQWAIVRGERISGVTTMLMDEGMDTGPILLQRTVPIEPEDTSISLSEKLASIGAGLLLDTIHQVRDGKIVARPQEGVPSYAPPLKKEDGRIDWSRSAADLLNLVRGMYPWPCAHTFFRGKYIKILQVEPVDDSGTPGTVIHASTDRISVAAGEGALSLLLLQPEGKTPIGPGPFANGYRVKEGDRFD